MGKKYSKQAWISREGPEGDCEVENDATKLTVNLTEEPKEKVSCTADFTYKGYPVNVDGPCGSEKELCKKYTYYDYPIEVVELPDEPDGKKFEVFFEREGQVEASTQTTRPPLAALSECGQSIKSAGSDRQEWSYTLYDFEGQGHVTRDDLKNLVKSIYEVLGKSVSPPKNSQKEPVKKLCVRLSLSKERSGNVTDMARRDCVLTTSGFKEHHRKSKAKKYLAVGREGSMTVNPPSTDYLSQIRPQSSLCAEPMQPENHGSSAAHHRRSSSCRRCEQRQPIEKDFLKNTSRKAIDPVDSRGMYHYPKRMQTGPGECNPPASNSNEMTRVKEWINQWCHMYDKKEDESTEEYHRHKHKVHHRHHRACAQPADSCEVGCGLRRCPQYLDLATDHLTYPYHTENACASASPRPQRHHKHSEHHHCKRNCCRDSGAYHHDGQPVVHRHEHHHHHSHHHYHHYVS